jgi:predicted short-subunit dehydrogenase-like oxidoreductase (DUF2520 family)
MTTTTAITGSHMKIVMIGSGNVATVLGKKFSEAGHNILQVYNRSLAGAEVLGNKLSAAFTTDWNKISADADLYIVALSDQAISALQPLPALHNKLVVHTAGSVATDVLGHLSNRYGVLYPLQTLRKEMNVEAGMPIIVNGSDASQTAVLIETGKSISDTVLQASDEHRFNLHIAAVFLNNFTNHLYALAETYCNKEGLSFDLLKPLILETAYRVMNHSPALLRTGPAVRGDGETIKKHLQKLETQPALHAVYLHLTESIQSVVHGAGG